MIYNIFCCLCCLSDPHFFIHLKLFPTIAHNMGSEYVFEWLHKQPHVSLINCVYHWQHQRTADLLWWCTLVCPLASSTWRRRRMWYSPSSWKSWKRCCQSCLSLTTSNVRSGDTHRWDNIIYAINQTSKSDVLFFLWKKWIHVQCSFSNFTINCSETQSSLWTLTSDSLMERFIDF